MLAGALVAFLQAMTLFGSPAILALPAGFHTMTTKIWSLFQYPPKPELAAAASLPLLVLTVILLRAEHMILGRRSYSVIGGKNSDPRIIQLGWLRWLALAFCFIVLLNPVFLPYGALFNAAFSQGRLAGDLVQQLHLPQHRFRVLRAVRDQARALQHLRARHRHRDARHHPGAGDRLSDHARGGAPATARSASSPPRRSPFPASCSASACS